MECTFKKKREENDQKRDGGCNRVIWVISEDNVKDRVKWKWRTRVMADPKELGEKVKEKMEKNFYNNIVYIYML